MMIPNNIESSPAEEGKFRRILADQITRYPQMDVQDLYKLIHQAALGSEHAVHRYEAARHWLQRELNELAEGPKEPVIDTISTDGQIARVNLRPYVESGGDLDKLLGAFIRSANEYRGTEDQLCSLWFCAEKLASSGELPYERDAMRAFFEKMKARSFPAVHHSVEYKEAYNPRYRVVSIEYLVDEE